jgi:hypothetical protein
MARNLISHAALGVEQVGFMIVRGADIGWDQRGESAYDRAHAEL